MRDSLCGRRRRRRRKARLLVLLLLLLLCHSLTLRSDGRGRNRRGGRARGGEQAHGQRGEEGPSTSKVETSTTMT